MIRAKYPSLFKNNYNEERKGFIDDYYLLASSECTFIFFTQNID